MAQREFVHRRPGNITVQQQGRLSVVDVTNICGFAKTKFEQLFKVSVQLHGRVFLQP